MSIIVNISSRGRCFLSLTVKTEKKNKVRGKDYSIATITLSSIHLLVNLKRATLIAKKPFLILLIKTENMKTANLTKDNEKKKHSIRHFKNEKTLC